MEQKFKIGQKVRVLSGEHPVEVVIDRIEWDNKNEMWKYYFLFEGEYYFEDDYAIEAI